MIGWLTVPVSTAQPSGVSAGGMFSVSVGGGAMPANTISGQGDVMTSVDLSKYQSLYRGDITTLQPNSVRSLFLIRYS